MKLKTPKNINYTALTTILASMTLSQGAWFWDVATLAGSAQNTQSTSLNWSLTPVANGSFNNSYQWDNAEEPVLFSVTSSDEPISFSIDNAGKFININFDPDGLGTYPTTLTATITYPYGVTNRQAASTLAGGGIGWLPNGAPVGSFTSTMSATDATGADLNIDSTFPYLSGGAGDFGPQSYAGGDATWNATNWAGFHYDKTDGGVDSGIFDFPTTALENDPSKQLGSQTFTMSNFVVSATGTPSIRFSMDGGVSSFASPVVVPEPTAFSLLGLGALGLLTRRKR